MKLRSPLLISLASRLLARTVCTHYSTLRYAYHPTGRSVVPTTPGLTERFLYTIWHEYLLLPSYLYRGLGLHVLASRHADGDIVAKTLGRLGYHSIRGSTNRGGIEAVRQIMALNKSSHVVLATDGPRGPRREMQPGAIYLASRTGLPIVAVGIGFDKPWRFKSWDRFAVPKPMSRAVLITSDPIVVPRDADREVLKHYHARIQRVMDDLTDRAERLAVGEKMELKAAA